MDHSWRSLVAFLYLVLSLYDASEFHDFIMRSLSISVRFLVATVSGSLCSLMAMSFLVFQIAHVMAHILNLTASTDSPEPTARHCFIPEGAGLSFYLKSTSYLGIPSTPSTCNRSDWRVGSQFPSDKGKTAIKFGGRYVQRGKSGFSAS